MAGFFHEQFSEEEKEILQVHDSGHLLGLPGVRLFLPVWDW